jgi:hypothetical protein
VEEHQSLATSLYAVSPTLKVRVPQWRFSFSLCVGSSIFLCRNLSCWNESEIGLSETEDCVVDAHLAKSGVQEGTPAQIQRRVTFVRSDEAIREADPVSSPGTQLPSPPLPKNLMGGSPNETAKPQHAKELSLEDIVAKPVSTAVFC